MNASLLLRTLAAEGPRGVLERARERAGEWREARAFPTLSASEAAGLRTEVLNVLPTAPAARLGGVPVQLRARLREEREGRRIALLFPHRGGFRLQIGGERPEGALALEGGWEQALRQAASIVGARLVHLENLAGVDPAAFLALAARDLPLVVSVHDYAFFCPRPHLLEQPQGAFCGFSRDLARCDRCLAADGTAPPGSQAGFRARAASLLRAARAVVFPSAFLRGRGADLAGPLDPDRLHVIAPASGVRSVVWGPGGPRIPYNRPDTTSRVAFVGAVKPHKGAALFAELAERWPRLARWAAFGGGDPEELRRLRAAGVDVHGYYRAGTLGRRLQAARVDAALALSIWPEAYGLVVDECVAAGVPVVAFDHGAIGERLRAWGAEQALVPPAGGAAGVARVLERPLSAPRPALPEPAEAARAHLALYARLRVKG